MTHQPTVAETEQSSEHSTPTPSAVSAQTISIVALAISGAVLLAGAILLYMRVVDIPGGDPNNSLMLGLWVIAVILSLAAGIPGIVRLRAIRQMATPPPGARRLTWIGIALGVGVTVIAFCFFGFIIMIAALGAVS